MNSQLDEITILLVEDNKKDRELIVKTLSKYFKNIIEAEDGKIGFEIFKNNKNIDIIISDINMPNLDGIDLLKLVRMSSLSIPFIITTAQIDSEVLMKAIDLNVSSFLLKPINLTKLLEKIDILCEKRHIKNKLKLKQNEIKHYIEAVNKVSLIFKMTADGSITYMNESMKLISKYNDNEISNLNFDQIIHPDIPKKYIEDTWTKIKSNELWHGNTKFVSKDKEVFYLNNTIFKIKDLSKEEYITIAFLNTKENLEKRDFHKKVLLNIKEANKKEYEFKKEIINLKQKIQDYEKFIEEKSDESFDKLQIKVYSKEKQIKLLEKEKIKLESKYESMLITKRNEVKVHIDTAHKYKVEIDKQKEDTKEVKKEIDATHKKILTLLDDITKKDKTIKDLRFIIKEMDNKS
ncbi:response regulator [Poseidonibacter ostreae]|uniref:Response regulator n=1 Tax=Poseidonibacter ostreae TaxID=2654171 RepID=A0A6L4WTD0_9BACT|nr:response regulator [Poseidonibacter ostreae]KAB7889192.1 response regulator [Poseidonibacter ostreae]KAB7891607.1 response regulator [Poseidonibacter ostreae]